MKNRHGLKPIKKLIGFDTETLFLNGAHSFYSAQFFSIECHLNTFIRTQEQLASMFTHQLEGTTLLTNNIEFDIAVLAKVLPLDRFDIRVLYNKSRCILATIKWGSHGCKLYDLGNIFVNWSLEKIGKLIGVEKLPKPSYLGLRAPNTPEEHQQFYEYAMRDAKIGYFAGVWLQNYFKNLRPTAPSLALYAYLQHRESNGVFLNCDEKEEWALREAYHGGRTEAWARGTLDTPVYAYDVVSLYPYVMQHYPFPLAYEKLRHSTRLELKEEGIAHCEVRQNADIPLLCVKKPFGDGIEKLVFPNGTFKGWFTLPELRYFTKHQLGEILACDFALYTTGQRFLFRNYIDRFFTLKSTQPEYASFWKLMMNSLYGKFGQKFDNSTVQIITDGTIKKLGEQKKRAFIKRQNVVIAAYVTAYARLHMHALYAKFGAQNVVYTDTDSIHSLVPFNECSDALGGLSFKYSGRATYVRSKFYLIDDLVACRGMERVFRAEIVRAMIKHNNVAVMNRLLLRLRSAHVRRRPFLTEVETLKRFSLDEDGKRDYAVHLSGEHLLDRFTLSKPVVVNGNT